MQGRRNSATPLDALVERHPCPDGAADESAGSTPKGACVARRTLRDHVLRSQRGQLFVAEPEDLGQDLIGVLTQ